MAFRRQLLRLPIGKRLSENFGIDKRPSRRVGIVAQLGDEIGRGGALGGVPRRLRLFSPRCHGNRRRFCGSGGSRPGAPLLGALAAAGLLPGRRRRASSLGRRRGGFRLLLLLSRQAPDDILDAEGLLLRLAGIRRRRLFPAERVAGLLLRSALRVRLPVAARRRLFLFFPGDEFNQGQDYIKHVVPFRQMAWRGERRPTAPGRTVRTRIAKNARSGRPFRTAAADIVRGRSESVPIRRGRYCCLGLLSLPPPPIELRISVSALRLFIR